jgi:hypothetical protein
MMMNDDVIIHHSLCICKGETEKEAEKENEVFHIN